MGEHASQHLAIATSTSPGRPGKPPRLTPRGGSVARRRRRPVRVHATPSPLAVRLLRDTDLRELVVVFGTRGIYKDQVGGSTGPCRPRQFGPAGLWCRGRCRLSRQATPTPGCNTSSMTQIKQRRRNWRRRAARPHKRPAARKYAVRRQEGDRRADSNSVAYSQPSINPKTNPNAGGKGGQPQGVLGGFI